MSKQQGQASEPEENFKSLGKKRKGKFILWMRLNPKYKDKIILGFNVINWFKIRKYETLEIAEKNKEAQLRKWNDRGIEVYYEFEITKES
jgi:hypothetical protein